MFCGFGDYYYYPRQPQGAIERIFAFLKDFAIIVV